MSLLDADRARAALGDRLADRFLQYAAEVDEASAQRLLVGIDEHLAQILHATERRGDPPGEHDLLVQLATTCKRLLRRFHDADTDARAAIVGAIRYFVETHDLNRDDRETGLDDVAQVVAYVVAEVAPDLEPVPAAGKTR